LDFGHGGINSIKKGWGVRLKSPRDIVVLVLGIVVVVIVVVIVFVIIVVVVIVVVVVVVVIAIILAGASDRVGHAGGLLSSASGSSLLAGSSGLLGKELLASCVLLAGEPDVEAAAAMPQEDGAGGRPFSCLGSAFGRQLVLGDAPGKEAFGEK
jgi:hypothetical protein